MHVCIKMNVFCFSPGVYLYGFFYLKPPQTYRGVANYSIRTFFHLNHLRISF